MTGTQDWEILPTPDALAIPAWELMRELGTIERHRAVREDVHRFLRDIQAYRERWSGPTDPATQVEQEIEWEDLSFRLDLLRQNCSDLHQEFMDFPFHANAFRRLRGTGQRTVGDPEPAPPRDEQ